VVSLGVRGRSGVRGFEDRKFESVHVLIQPGTLQKATINQKWLLHPWCSKVAPVMMDKLYGARHVAVPKAAAKAGAKAMAAPPPAKRRRLSAADM
jgi:hypothetical protein